ncbi:hypothetical protein TPY_1302 [Sulfobacillus acidophilus TPY]|nr:hypothetical protein TPY_1302 [Sulfobacillus acidophilus TPY]
MMADWMGGPFGSGPWTDWIQSMVSNVTGNLRGLIGFPREEMLKHMDDFALRSMKRHLEARREDIEDMLRSVEAELARRQEPGYAPDPTPTEED